MGVMLHRIGLLEQGSGGGGGATDPHFASTVLVVNIDNDGPGADTHFASTVLVVNLEDS